MSRPGKSTVQYSRTGNTVALVPDLFHSSVQPMLKHSASPLIEMSVQ